MWSCGVWHNTWYLRPCGLFCNFFAITQTLFYDLILHGISCQYITQSWGPHVVVSLTPKEQECQVHTKTVYFHKEESLHLHMYSTCNQVALCVFARWFHIWEQPVLYSVVVKINIDCNSHQVSVDEWVLVSCWSFSPVTVSTPLMLPLWHPWCW